MMEIQKTTLRILLTDDDEGDRLVFKEIFEEMDKETTVDMVNDGRLLMDFLKKEDNLLPHIIFLDLNMPNMNGIECLKEIRRHEKYSDIFRLPSTLLQCLKRISRILSTTEPISTSLNRATTMNSNKYSTRHCLLLA